MLTRLKTFLVENFAFSTLAVLIITLVSLAAVLQGCDLRKAVTVDAPKPVVSVVYPDKPDTVVTLADSQRVWEDWTHYVTTNSDRYKAAVTDAEQRYQFLVSVADMGLDLAAAPIAGIPYGNLLLPVLTGAAGLYLRRPGDAEKMRVAQMDSYNKGRSDTLKTLGKTDATA